MNKQLKRSRKNRRYKDSVFVDLFAKDITAKANFIELYNALHGTALIAETTQVTHVELKQTLYRGVYNDLACVVNGKIIILAEHQSTVNENMPLRFLIYITHILEHLTQNDDRYARKLIPLPYPEFFVFYNGRQKLPTEQILCLSDAYDLDGLATQGVNLELRVRVININVQEQVDLLARCRTLNEYSTFVESVIRHSTTDPDSGFDAAIQECINNGVLAEYLQRKSKEVRNMFFGEYSYEDDIRVQRREAREEGIGEGVAIGVAQGLEQGLEQGIEQGEHRARVETALNFKRDGLSLELIARNTGLTIEEIDRL